MNSLHLLVILLLCLCNVTVTDMTQQHIRITAWNSRGLGSAGPYLSKLMKRSDILCISEHQLYECELNRLNELDSEFIGYGKSSLSLKPENYGKVPGHCGVGILWRKSISSHVRPLRQLGTDRFCAVELTFAGQKPLYVVSMYMPQQSCQISDYDSHMDSLEACISQWQGDTVLIGDWNIHLGPEFGPRGWGKTSRNGRCVSSLLERHPLMAIDLTETCEGPIYTFCNSTGTTTYIDHCFVSLSILNQINTCQILDDEVQNTSDHLAMAVTIELKEPVRIPSCETPKQQVVWHKLSAEQITEQYTETLDALTVQYQAQENRPDDVTQWTRADMEGVTQAIILMTKQASRGLIKTRNSKYVKPYWNKDLKSLSMEKQTIWREWVAQGKPKSPDSSIWNENQQA